MTAQEPLSGQPTWPCGLTKSINNAFTVAPRSPDSNLGKKPKTQKQIDAARASCLAYYYRKAAMKKIALRVNKQDFSFSPDPQGDSDRTAQIVGKRLKARS